ncbi:hypothetical protein ACFOU2_00100 [Bacillus songklensis]|uniref:Uncharacterized protein n=1 Tax=Bacillus songklensis TaxID=1069116 RepID=A0ABV8AVK8_9BACI
MPAKKSKRSKEDDELLAKFVKLAMKDKGKLTLKVKPKKVK